MKMFNLRLVSLPVRQMGSQTAGGSSDGGHFAELQEFKQ